MIERYEELVRENKRLKAQLETARQGHYRAQAAIARVGRPQIREAFLRNGARIEPGRDDLPDHVYEAAFELLEMAAPAVQGEPVSLRQHLFNGWEGCSNHGCVVVDPKPGMMRTNGSCQCVVNASRSQLYMLQGRIQSVLSATPQPAEQQPAPDVAGLESALKSMVSGYMRLLQSGYDRITDLGGDCDPVDVMERDDACLRKARAALAAHRKQGG